jgi:membrane protein
MRALAKDVVGRWRDTDLLTYGSAIAFQVLFALIPLALFGLGLMGFLGLQDVYSDDVRPELEKSMSPAAYSVVDDTVRKVLESQQFFWITAGLVIAIWEMSGAVRAIMQIFDRIYRSERERAFRERYTTSILLAIGAGALLLAAVAVAQLVPRVVDAPLSWLRWPVAIALMTATVALLMRYAPADHQPVRLVGAGTAIVVAAWTVTSIGFGLYVTQVADYGSIFGNLATAIILFEYLYLAACAFLTGAVLESMRRDGNP